MEERDKKKMDQLKKKLHTDDEGLIYAFSIVCSNNNNNDLNMFIQDCCISFKKKLLPVQVL